MEFRVLGPLEVTDDGRPVSLGSGRQVRLLSCLLLHPNQVVPRDLLIDALWGERAPKTADNAVRVQVHALRKLLGEERIETDGPGYRLRVELGELDAERFETLVARGRAELASGDGDSAAETLRQALELWRGPAFADVAYDAFTQNEIARLDELRLAALEERIEADLTLGRHRDRVPELEALVGEHPHRERLHGQLMLALYRSGQQSAALSVYRRFRRALDEELGLEPGAELKELEQAMLRQDAVLRVEPRELRVRRHLPAAQTTLVGRRRELDEVGATLRGGTRLVTLTGPGGTGKTRLATQAAHELADAFPDGVYFVDLSALRDPSLVGSEIEQALGAEELTLERHLRERRTLLVLDNFEQVEEAATRISELLSAAPEVAVLVTSRTPLRLSAEHEYRVPALPLGDAARLFTERAAAVAPTFRRVSEEADEISEICRRLDCLPLALELAAARTREHSPAELLTLLPSTLELASRGARDLPERQQTLRAAIGWSYDLLAPEEQRLFARLGVFAGGSTVGAAEAVCETTRAELSSLVSTSLVYERPGRFLMLETIREYALERLEESGEADAVRRKHAEHFAALAESTDDEAVLEEEHDNLRAAVDWSSESGAADLELRLAAALAIFWAVRNHLQEGRERVEAALAHSADGVAASRAKALGGGSWIALRVGEYERAEELAEASLALYRELGDEPEIALALNRLGAAVSNRGDTARGISLQKESAAIYNRLGDERGVAVVLNNLGYRLVIEGAYEEARFLLDESLSLFRKLDQRESMPLPLINLGLAALMQDRHEEARAYYREGLELAHEVGLVVLTLHALDGLAAALAGLGEAEQAATFLGAAEAAIEGSGASLEPLEQEIHDRTAAAVDGFGSALAAGRQLPLDDAVALALQATSRSSIRRSAGTG